MHRRRQQQARQRPAKGDGVEVIGGRVACRPSIAAKHANLVSQRLQVQWYQTRLPHLPRWGAVHKNRSAAIFGLPRANFELEEIHGNVGRGDLEYVAHPVQQIII